MFVKSKGKFVFECVNCKYKTELLITRVEGSNNIFCGKYYNGLIIIENSVDIDSLSFDGFDYSNKHLYLRYYCLKEDSVDSREKGTFEIFDVSKRKTDSTVMMLKFPQKNQCKTCCDFGNETLQFKKASLKESGFFPAGIH